MLMKNINCINRTYLLTFINIKALIFVLLILYLVVHDFREGIGGGEVFVSLMYGKVRRQFVLIFLYY